MTRMLAALLLLASGGLAQAASPKDFVRQWPVSAQEEGAYAVELSEEVYRSATRADLSDVAAFDAEGDALAFGPMPAAFVPPKGTWQPARWFPLPDYGRAVLTNLHLLTHRSPSGELVLEASVQRDGAASGGRDLLIDVRGPGPTQERQVDALSFDFAQEGKPFTAFAVVEASEDLRTWRKVAWQVPVAFLREGAQTLVRRQVELEPTTAGYLRVRLEGSVTAPSVRAVQLRTRVPGEVPQPSWLEATFVRRDERGGYVYRLPARVPAEQLDVQLGADNAVAHFSLQSREAPANGWRSQGALTAFRLRGAGLELVNEPAMLAPTREREWRLETTTSLSRPPVLRLAYFPERWLLLTRGKSPYAVAAGSERARRDDYPLDALVSQVRAKYGAEWQPPLVTLGAAQAAGGEAALRPVGKDRARTWVLWAVLVLGAVAVMAMVLRLLKAPPPARGPQGE